MLAAGLGSGMAVFSAMMFFPTSGVVQAASNDRYQDFVMATGAVSINPRIQTDGVWFLDYKSGKLLGTVIDKTQGRIMGWAEVDLVEEFKVQPKQDVHFMMTTGYITQTQSALYLAETTTGQFGIYTMATGLNGSGIVIKRHDLGSFRKGPAEQPVVAPAPGVAPVVPSLPGTGGAPQPVPPIPMNPLPTLPNAPGLPSGR
jgi:hypothetical protein